MHAGVQPWFSVVCTPHCHTVCVCVCARADRRAGSCDPHCTSPAVTPTLSHSVCVCVLELTDELEAVIPTALVQL